MGYWQVRKNRKGSAWFCYLFLYKITTKAKEPWRRRRRRRRKERCDGARFDFSACAFPGELSRALSEKKLFVKDAVRVLHEPCSVTHKGLGTRWSGRSTCFTTWFSSGKEAATPSHLCMWRQHVSIKNSTLYDEGWENSNPRKPMRLTCLPFETVIIWFPVLPTQYHSYFGL